MKLSVALTATCATVAAAGRQGAVYRFGPPQPTTVAPSTATISLSDARVFLAQQVGLSEFHSLAGTDELVLQLLNQYKNDEDPLFMMQLRIEKRRTLMIAEGLEEIPDSDTYIKQWDRVAALSHLPSEQDNVKFVEELLELAQSQRGRTLGCRMRDTGLISGVVAGGSVGPESYGICTPENMNQPTNAHPSVRSPYAFEDSSSLSRDDRIVDIFYVKASEQNSQEVLELLQRFTRRAQRQDTEITLVTIPTGSVHSSKSYAWAARTLAKRESEEVLSISSEKSASSGKSPGKSHALAGSNAQVSAIMSRCAATLEDCESRTNNCTGHGKCRSSSNSTGGGCWSCACSATKESWGTAYWGGAACQKRDISVQFWLFAISGIAATAGVTWAVGLLYSMGEEDLPSVLGAGVAPALRK